MSVNSHAHATAASNPLAELCLTSAVLIGGFSLARIDPVFERLGLFGELRYALLATVLILLIGSIALRPSPPLGRRLTMFLTSVVALHLAILFSATWASPHGFERGFPTLDLIASMTFAPLVAIAWHRTPHRGLLWTLGGACVLSMALVIAAFATGDPFAGEFQALGAGGIGTARTYGLALIGALYFSEKFKRHGFLFLVPVIALGILASGARAAALGTVIGLGSWFFSSLLGRKRRKVIALAAATAMITLALTSALVSDTAVTVVESFIASLWSPATTVIGSSDSLYLADRDEIFLEALAIFVANPIAGLGFGTYYAGYQGFLGASVGEVYPHNIVLNIAVDAGLIGLLPAFVAAVACLKGSKPTQSVDSAAAFAALMYTLSLATFNGTYYDFRLAWTFAVLLIASSNLQLVMPNAVKRGASGSDRKIPTRTHDNFRTMDITNRTVALALNLANPTKSERNHPAGRRPFHLLNGLVSRNVYQRSKRRAQTI